jgi:group I intron endonuclease
MDLGEKWRGVCGVYAITNVITNARYFGSARCLVTRSRQHRCDLRAQRHANERLQRAWNKYGEDAFTFSVLAVLEKSEQYETESRLLQLKVGRAGCYNLALDARNAMLGRKHSESTRAAMSVNRMGRPGTWNGRRHSKESLAKMSAAQKGHATSAEAREKLSRAFAGKKRPLHLVERTAAGHRGQKRSAGTRERIAASKRGLRPTEETRAKMSVSRTGRKRSPESVAKSAASHRGVPRTPEQRAAISAGMTEVGRQKLSEQKAAYWAAWRAKKATLAN